MRNLLVSASVGALLSGCSAAATQPTTTENLNQAQFNYQIEQTNYRVEECAGTLVDLEERLIVTSFHCVLDKMLVARLERRSTTPVSVEDYDGREWHALVAGVDPENDLALVRAPGALYSDMEAPVAPRGYTPRRLDRVMAVGNPFGALRFTATWGHVNAELRRFKTSTGESPVPVIQFDAPVTHGNSGGGLFNEQGQLIGVVFGYRATATVNRQGFNFATTSNAVRDLIQESGYGSEAGDD